MEFNLAVLVLREALRGHLPAFTACRPALQGTRLEIWLLPLETPAETLPLLSVCVLPPREALLSVRLPSPPTPPEVFSTSHPPPARPRGLPSPRPAPSRSSTTPPTTDSTPTEGEPGTTSEK